MSKGQEAQQGTVLTLPLRARAATSDELRTRGAGDDAEGVVVAYASVFDTEYDIGPFGDVRERIARGAFEDSIAARSSLPVFYQHGWSDGPIGVTEEVAEDEHGVYVRGRLFIDDDPRARSVWRAMDAGALVEWSVGFFADEVEVEESDGVRIETVTRGRLLEASVVVAGANPDTDTLEVRDLTAVKRQFGEYPFGSFEECVERLAEEEHIDDAEGLCAAWHHDATGEWPGQSSADEPARQTGSVDPERAAAMLRRPAMREALREVVSSGSAPSGA